MLSVMSSLVLASSLLAQTPAVQSTAQPQAETVNAQGQVLVSPSQAKPAQMKAIVAPQSNRTAKRGKPSPTTAALVARLQASQAKAAASAKLAGDDGVNPAQPRKPYEFTGPGWIKHPLTDAEQLRRFGAIVTPAPRGGEENQPERISPEFRAQLNAITAAALAPKNPYAPRDACTDITASQSQPQRFQPIGPAPLGGDDDVSSPESLLQNEFWSQMPASGRVLSIACEPQVDATPATKSVIIGTLGGGLWKTDNALDGTSTVWRNVSDSVTSDTRHISAFGAIAYAPSDSNIVYATDGSYLDLIEGSGLFRSSNGGASWTRIGNNLTGAQEVLSQLFVSPNDPNVIYIGYADSLQNGNGMLTRLEIKYKLDGTIDNITESVMSDDNGAPINAAVTGIVWTALGYPLVAFDGLGVYLWIDDADLSLQVGRTVIGRGIRDFRRILLTSNPAGTTYFAALVGAGGNLAQAVRCTSVELDDWEALPLGTVDETGDHGLPNAFATYGSLTGFVTINPRRPSQAIVGGVSPYFADAGMTITDNFLTEISSGPELIEPTWYEMTRSQVPPITVVPDVERSKIVRGVHPYQNAAAWDSSGNLWVGHNGGVCMVAVDQLGIGVAPKYEDKNGGAAGVPQRRPTVDAGSLNTMLAISSSLSPHNNKLLITGMENNGAGEITPNFVADPDANPTQVNFTSITGDDQFKPDPEVDPTAVRGRWIGGEVGPLVFDPRKRLGEANGDSRPAQIYLTAPGLSYTVVRRNGVRITFPDVNNPDNPDDLAPPVDAGTMGPMTGNWIIDRRDTYPPLVAAKLAAPVDNPVINPSFDPIFGSLITGTSRIWMIADPAQFLIQNGGTANVPQPGPHAQWQVIQASAPLLIEPFGTNAFRRGTVTSIGFAKKQGVQADDLSVLWFTSTAGRLCRLIAEVDEDSGNVILDPTKNIPNYTQGQKIYPPTGERASLFRAADVAVNPLNKNEVYVCFRMPFDELTTDGTAVRVARIAKITVTQDFDIDGNPFDVVNVLPVSTTFPNNLTPRTIAVNWGGSSNPDVIYVGTGTGLYVSDNGGVSWELADPVMPLGQVRDIELVANDTTSASSGHMAVSFYGRGVWMCLQRTPVCLADFNRDSNLTLDDVDLFVNGWIDGCPSTDINLDGLVDFQDLDKFIDAFENGLCT